MLSVSQVRGEFGFPSRVESVNSELLVWERINLHSSSGPIPLY